MNLKFINDLKNRLKLPLPGQDVQFEMAHINREKLKIEDYKPSEYRKSAVMLLLCPRQESFFIPLTERHTYKGAHSGQISLPGGKFDEADRTLDVTARRECFEEIGVSSDIEMLGELTPLYIPVSRFMVYPFVGFLNNEEVAYQLDQAEVKDLAELDLEELLKPHIVKETFVEPAPGIKFKTPYFDVQGKIVWGATAMILNEFKTIVQQL
jgi:8-oxo-dGTP pyrophosphatase MutT (NUDIX family)